MYAASYFQDPLKSLEGGLMVGVQEISNKDSFLVSYLSFFSLSCLNLLFLTPGGALYR